MKLEYNQVNLMNSHQILIITYQKFCIFFKKEYSKGTALMSKNIHYRGHSIHYFGESALPLEKHYIGGNYLIKIP